MATLFPFACLSRANQERVVARFFDACGHDGYLYELDVDGTVLCRCRSDLRRHSTPQPSPSRPAPSYRPSQ